MSTDPITSPDFLAALYRIALDAPSSYRALLMHLSEKRGREAAAELGISENVYRQRVHYAKQKMIEYLGLDLNETVYYEGRSITRRMWMKTERRFPAAG